MKSLTRLQKIAIGLFVGIIAFMGWNAYDEAETRKENERREQEQLENIRNHITSYVIAERSTYQYSNLGGIYGLSIKVQNNTDYVIDKVVVKVSYIKPSGDIWKDKLVEFHYIEPRKMIENRVADEPRGVRIDYQIVSISSRSLGL